ncbi:hypothetical protein [Geoalkalibacter subterraneus]|uniref:Uncharacterized protein n=1 Tax=Geoalkalibacter subterraneus TaxID=483547 RepID=A0A0B5FVH4_9BACT|nr:hypothetical protein [Geoalkalibacter subterraneus]AJF08175.1 hypothetical protein GSUB_16900 [Geoalkalibacter subterraneus]
MKFFNLQKLVFCLLILLATSGGCSVPLGLKSPPEWIKSPLVETPEGLVVVGVSYPSSDERSARDGALLHALQQTLRFAGMHIDTYTRIVATERMSDQDHQAQNETIEKTAIATQGFIERIEQQDWALIPADESSRIAYVKVFVPSREIDRLKNERKRLQDQAYAPYKKVRRAFSDAIAQHDVARALTLARQVCTAYEQMIAAWPGENLPENRPILEGLYQQVLIDVSFELKSKQIKVPDKRTNSEVAVSILHQGQPTVPGVDISLELPSGKKVACRSKDKSVAFCNIAPAAYPGTYSLKVAPVLPNGEQAEDYSQKVTLTVVGEPSFLASGEFHDFIEVSATGSVDPSGYDTVEDVVSMAVKTARTLAYAKLVEKIEGMQIQTRQQIEDGSLVAAKIVSTSEGHVRAKVTDAKIRWRSDRPVADITLRAYLAKNHHGGDR